MEDTKKICADCKHLMFNESLVSSPYQEILCTKAGWYGVEHIEDLYEPVYCEHFEEIER